MISSAKKALFKELILYGIIGGSTALADILLFKLFRDIGIPRLIANFCSVNIAIASSFILNAKYNFKKTNDLLKRGIKFFLVGYIGLLISFILLWLGTDILKMEEVLVKTLSVVVVAAVQYLLNKFLTFRK